MLCWADNADVSFTWFDTTVIRPESRGDLRTILVHNNRLTEQEPEEWSERWGVWLGPRKRLWVEALRPGDIIQLIPRAMYMAWTNIVDGGSIRIEYEAEEVLEDLHTLTISSNTSHYSQILEIERQDIRLLNVKPGAFDDPISASFSTVSLKDAEVMGIGFHALSYCWGDSSEREEIMLFSNQDEVDDGVPFSIGKSAAQALRRLRSEKTTLVIWVDAVCINQDDLEERAQQVTLMAQIYSLAAIVHIWLGEDNPGVEACLKLVRDICNYNSEECQGGEACSCLWTKHSSPLEEIKAFAEEVKKSGRKVSFKGMIEVFEVHLKTWSRAIIDMAGWYGNTQLSFLMSSLYENPWFSRVWVIQEALSAKFPLVHCSAEKVPWEEVVQVSNWLQQPDYATQNPHVASQQHSMAPIWKTLKPKGRTTEVPNTPIEVQNTDELSGILEVFLSGLDLKATDSRDKLFALLTFADETHDVSKLDDLIRPNYDKPNERVFADFTRWWIREHNSLEILSYIHCQPTRTWVKTVGQVTERLLPCRPTWSIDSKGSSKWTRANLNTLFKFKASGETKPDLTFLETEDALVLRLSGLRITEIKKISCIPIEHMYPYQNASQNRKEICQVLHQIIDPCGLTPFWARRNTSGEILQKSIQECNMKYGDHMNSHWAYADRPALQVLQPNAKAEVNYYETNKLPTCIEPCFFVTTSGLFGLCPWMSKEGDIIVLLDGGNVPYLLRPADKKDGELRYELVGECFVSGIMHGEVLDALGQNADHKQIFSLV
ncbi:hypothetical protein LB507_005731 [Fusarium sp. FIESC RH6]|nr:hypothetical protein LB507_005731 [Fusarium sp. FIESC RH6]